MENAGNDWHLLSIREVLCRIHSQWCSRRVLDNSSAHENGHATVVETFLIDRSILWMQSNYQFRTSNIQHSFYLQPAKLDLKWIGVDRSIEIRAASLRIIKSWRMEASSGFEAKVTNWSSLFPRSLKTFKKERRISQSPAQLVSEPLLGQMGLAGRSEATSRWCMTPGVVQQSSVREI